MFERYLAEALAVHFGQFIQDFDADKVKISVWNGEVVLKDLKLKRDAFQRLLDKSASGDSNDSKRGDRGSGNGISNSFNDNANANNNADGNASATATATNNNNVDNDTNENVNESLPPSKDDDEEEEEEEDGLFPCEISYGHIGTFELHIPWTLLRSSQIGSLESSGWSMWRGVGGVNTSNTASSSANNATNAGSSSSSNASDYNTNKARGNQNKEDGCSITLSDVNILMNPVKTSSTTTSSSSSSSKKRKKYTQQEINERLKKDRIRKERQVQKILDEALFRKNIDFASDEQQKQQKHEQQQISTSQSFIRNLIQNIVSSLSITVKNVHIRYEDPGDCLGFDTKIRLDETRRLRYRPPFAVGVTLKEFTVYSTKNGPLSDDQLYSVPDMIHDDDGDDIDNNNDHRNRGQQKQQPLSLEGKLYTAQHKLAAAKNLSIYWDSDLPVKRMIHISANKRIQRRRREHELITQFQRIDTSNRVVGAESVKQSASNQEEKDAVSSNDDVNHDNDILGRKKDCDFYSYEDEEEFNQFYASMLQQMIDIPEDQEVHDSSYRTYIIEPISPSLHFSVINALPQEQVSKSNSTPTTTPADYQIPPSRAVLTLPPFQTNLSKDTLEDIGYLRRSFGLWKDMRNSILTRKVYMQFMKLRPNTRPKEDPKSWWRYAFEAVKMLSKLRHEKQDSRRNTKGWLGLSNALQLQKKYITLYEKLLEKSSEDSESKNMLSKELSDLEDRLYVNEIVAFRTTLVLRKLSQMRRFKERQLNQTKGSQPSSTWSTWISPWSSQLQSASTRERDDLLINKSKEYRFFSDDEILSAEHRESIIYEITDGLGIDGNQNFTSLIGNVYNRRASTSGGMQFLESNVGSGSKLEVSIICPQVTLQAENVVVNNMQRFEFGQSDNIKIRRRRPIIQLRFSSVQKYCLRHDNSWELLCTLASLEVLNLMNMNRQALDDCQRLLTRKTKLKSAAQETSYKSVHFGDISHFHSATVAVRKTFYQRQEHGKTDSKNSATEINVNISPMEATYSLEPINAFRELYSTTQTTELASDYQRLKSVFSNWRAQQRRKLLEALSQREKTIVVKVDVAAPVFYMHDDLSNGTLMVDLGNLAFHNGQNGGKSSYDDSWRLLLTDIQVSSLPRSEPSGKSKLAFIDHHATCHIVEPFSLDFLVYTKFGAKQWSDDKNDSGILNDAFIKATLPRLVFNLTSSSVRLLHRLKAQNSVTQSKNLLSQETRHGDTLTASNNNTAYRETTQQSNDENGRKLLLKFEFSAPLVVVNLSNDVDGRDCIPRSNSEQNGSRSTPIAQLVMQGIGGQLSHCSDSVGVKKETIFVASLKALHAKDLYQKAGLDYSMLMSSQCPKSLYSKDVKMWINDSFDELTKQFMNQVSQNDLVRIEYDQSSQGLSGIEKRNLKIKFHELFVEWNPETLAAMQKAMRMSLEGRHLLNNLTENADDFDFVDINLLDETYYQCDSTDDDDTVFFDANELEDHPPVKLSSLETLSYSEDDRDHLGNLDFAKSNPNQYPYSPILTPMVLEAVRALSTRKQRGQHFWGESDDEKDPEEILPSPKSTIAVFFHLSKLRVRFNKESRFRRLITAEMSETSVRYETKPFGGMSTNVKVGNLSLTDPSHKTGSTLYGEILGIKSDVHGMASLLEIQFETFPRSEGDGNDQQRHRQQMHPRTSVSVNSESLKVSGCDNYISLHFSPMRFVLLQQLWLELIDYFFEGVLGSEVWGKVQPKDASKNREKEIVDEIRMFKESDRIAGANANGIRFTLFEIVMDCPTILMPVAYRSPQHLSFDISAIRISNEYSAKNVSCEATGGLSYIQWYNNCNVKMCEMTLSTWCGKILSIFDKDPKLLSPKSIEPGSIPMNISIKWPTGPYAQLIVPKWDVQFQMTTVRLLPRKIDFALFRNVVWYNIGEESRHLDEWNALQSLPYEELEEYKKRIMVHFGYDKKDAAPTTYNISISMKSIIIHLCNDLSDYVADIDCFGFKWSLVKKKDRISRQQLVCNKIHLEQTSDNVEWGRFKKVFFPLECQLNIVNDNFLPQPQLFYTSTSRPTGDNVKYLEVNNACILFIYPALMNVKSFFQSLPPPDIMHRDEVINSLQIGDRWYRINKSGSEEEFKAFQFLEERKRSEDTQKSNKMENKKEYQLRVVLVAPRIILVDSSCLQKPPHESAKALTLRLGHLDFFRKIDADESNTRTLFIHDLEVFTGLADDAIRRGNSGNERSLIFPLSLGAGSSYHLGHEDYNTVLSERWFITDVISARAAYTDMILAIDVLQKTMSDYRSVNSGSKAKDSNVIHSQKSHQEEARIRGSINVALGGFELLVVDDSGRHFLNAQELVQVSLIGIRCNKWQGLTNDQKSSESDNIESITRLQLKGLEVIDFLQPKTSPFRLVAATKGISQDGNEATRWENMNRTVFDDFMTWDRYKMVESNWGYYLSPSLVERMKIAKLDELESKNLSNFVDITRSTYVGQKDSITFEIREIVLQWNPSMAIALQRFLGRLKKQAMEKNLLLQSSRSTHTENKADEQRFLRAELKINALTLCLNKEHQHRRLLQVTLSDAMIVSERDHLHRLNFHGYVGDINAWDCDNNREGNLAIRDNNRLVLCVLRDPVFDDDNNSCSTNGSEFEKKRQQKKFLSFQYYCRPKISQTKSDDLNQSVLPQWVVRTVGKETSSKYIDDCLSLSVAAIRFNYLSDRTGEVVDYLSNGLPGRGMGATSRAAKGFIHKRIRTRSYLVVTLKAPQLFIPRHRGDEEGIMISLGDVHVRSWFDEATLQECEAIKCKDLTVQTDFSTSINDKRSENGEEKFWWRILSVSFLELGWRIHSPKRSSLSIDNPVDLHLHLRKPPSESNLSLVVRCKLSFMDLVLSYMDYILLRSVLNENIMKHVDKTLWDDVDDSRSTDENQLKDDRSTSAGLLYAENARFVRYGNLSKRTALSEDEIDPNLISKGNGTTNIPDMREEVGSTTLIDLKFDLAGLNLILHRDDPIEKQSKHFPLDNSELNYDIVSFEVDQVELAIATSEAGAKSATLKLHQLSLFDQGDVGRIAREKFMRSPLGSRRPSAFWVIAESYDAFEGHGDNAVIDDNGEILRQPQITLTIDTRPAADVDFGGLVDQCHNTTVTVACLRMNYMNVNPLVRPIKDITDFLLCKWWVEKSIGGAGLKPIESSREVGTPIESSPDHNEESRAVRGFQLKVVAHYPRIFLIADECDPASRALVLRGLVVLTASVIKEILNKPRRIEGKTHLTVEGQLHSLESYINPKPRHILENERLATEDSDILGVALIEPVTAGFHFHQITRVNFPMTRDMYINLEPVSTTLSFEDIHLIETVLSKWKYASKNDVNQSRNQSNKKNQGDDGENIFFFPQSFDQGSFDNDGKISHNNSSITQTDSADIFSSGAYCGGYLPCNRNFGAKSPKEIKLNDIAAGTEYSVQFTEQTLGLALRKTGSCIIVDRILDSHCASEVMVGDKVISINGKSVTKLTLKAIVASLADSPRPLNILFQRSSSINNNIIDSQDRNSVILEEEWDDNIGDMDDFYSERLESTSNDSFAPSTISATKDKSELESTGRRYPYNVRINRRQPHGLCLESSPCGNVAIVSSVQNDIFKAVVVDYENSTPKPGHVILAIDDEPVYDKSFKQIQKILNDAGTSETKEFCKITFVELTSEDWGPVNRMDIVISGIKLTLIDDIAGRDMPLLRWNLESIAVKVERGLGLECNNIHPLPPSIINFDPRERIADLYVISDLSEAISKICASFYTRLDYYNAKIASWEPCLELCQMNGNLEYQQGRPGRPGALSIALSDHRLSHDSEGLQQALICINLTDAAAHILISAFYEWKQWHGRLNKGINSKQFEELKLEPIPPNYHQHIMKNDGVLDLKKGAVQDAAQAALIYAQRRGVDSKGANGSKPFILRNKSGMDISFVPQMQQNFKLHDRSLKGDSSEKIYDLEEFNESCLTVIANGEEASFSMDRIEGDGPSSENHNITKNGNKVRTYDGSFPLLTVCLLCSDTGTNIEVAQDLSVEKIRKKLIRLQVRKTCGTKSQLGIIYVIWSVELERNRRIITFSSAISLTAPRCSIPIEIGVKVYDDGLLNGEGNTSKITPIGFATSENECHLPLWIDLCFLRAEVYIRPKGDKYGFRWSTEKILEYKIVGGDDHLDSKIPQNWKWSVCKLPGNTMCEPDQTDIIANMFPAWLAYEYLNEAKTMNTKSKRNESGNEYTDSEFNNYVICLSIFTTLSIRNILPESLEWEVLNDKCVIDGTSTRNNNNSLVTGHHHSDQEFSSMIKSGDNIEVLACDIVSMNTKLRFRCGSGHAWTEFLVMKDFEVAENEESKPHQTNLHVVSECSVPLTIGVKIIPKTTVINKGFDLVLYCELWLCNLTSLPVIFGATSNQLTLDDKRKTSEKSERTLNAENALLELSSILEFGDKGHSFISDQEKPSDVVEILNLPKQQSEVITEEVFEYVEIDKGNIKKQWWAGEKHDNPRPSPEYFEGSNANKIKWIDKYWKIDVAGECKAHHGGWESCSNLVGGIARYFPQDRSFDKHHRYRRRRWFRKRRNDQIDDQANNLSSRIPSTTNIAFHQPIIDFKARAKRIWKRKMNSTVKDSGNKAVSKSVSDVASAIEDQNGFKIYFKVGDGMWSKPAIIPNIGGGHGVVRLQSSRWPKITSKMSLRKRLRKSVDEGKISYAYKNAQSKVHYCRGNLSSRSYELSYQISIIEGPWGDYSRLLMLYPRFILRNDSDLFDLDVKQAGTPDNTSIHVASGSSVPFYWTDSNLPELICVRPVVLDPNGKPIRCYRWSGGLDICDLGMIPLRIREESAFEKISIRNMKRLKMELSDIRVIRSLIEIRSGTGGTGITISFKEESPNGEDSLYRIENHSPFPLWIAQDGVLANPKYEMGLTKLNPMEIPSSQNTSERQGDKLNPGEMIAFGLDVPFRQGKYAGRRAALFEELMTIRIALAPLSLRDGIETMKVVALAYVGSSFRLKPSNLRFSLHEDMLSEMININVQGIVCADGPTRVLKLSLVERSISTTRMLRNTVRLQASTTHKKAESADDPLTAELVTAAETVCKLMKANIIPKSDDVDFVRDSTIKSEISDSNDEEANCVYSFSAFFYGFAISLIDTVPSEIAVISMKKLNLMAHWDKKRISEAEGAISIEWLQIDNQCPNAPFPVAFSPVITEQEDYEDIQDEDPFLCIGVVLAPHHKSNILCLKGLSIKPKDVDVCTDLAFIMRMQHFFLSIQDHFDRCEEEDRLNSHHYGASSTWLFPDMNTTWKRKIGSTNTIQSSVKLYFESLSIVPFNIKLSVAPAVALSAAQSTLEGKEAGAIHAAVRKGDVLVGEDTSGVLGVKIGGKNRTALAVIRGIFKSILVDSLLRFDGASMSFSGVILRNHIATTSQLKTYIGHHYLSLLKSNVPALLGSLSAFGNPVGLIRGFGDGVTDFVSEPIKGIRKSVKELDPSYAARGVARGTGSLARNTVGGIVDSASLLTESFSKSMAVLTLDRKYAQRRDRFKTQPGTSTNFVQGVESGMGKLLRGVAEGVIGVVRAPVRGAEKRGVEGFAKGVGKGLLGLVVKPVIGLSDAATDVMVGVKGSLDGVGKGGLRGSKITQIRPRRAFYGNDRSLRNYEIEDAISSAIMMRTRLAGENYLSHVDLGGRVAILGVKRFLLLGDDGQTELLIKLKNIAGVEMRHIPKQDESGMEWGVLIFLKNNKHGNDIEVIITEEKGIALELCTKIKQGMNFAAKG